MFKKIPIGVDNFRELVNPDKNFLFVDKSLLIKEFIDRGTKLSLITRPRRWGKTLNMSMLQHFFAPEVNGCSTKNMFNNLNIATEQDGLYLAEQGRYPVIFISFKNVKQSNYGLFLQEMRDLMAATFREHENVVINSLQLSDSQKTLYKSVLSSACNTAQLKNSIKFLSECLYSHYKKNVFILIDEYDSPLNAAYGRADFEEIVEFFKGLLGSALKGNAALEKGLMTGILRLSKNNMLSDLNNLKLYSLMEEQYSQFFGFAEQEVKSLFSEANLNIDIKELQNWYNGYLSGSLINVYNPWSILNCIDDHGNLKAYWIKTGDEALLKNIFTNLSKTVEDKIFGLLAGNSIKASIDEYLSFDQVGNGREEALWSLLWATGYLTFVKPPEISYMGNYVGLLAIPNYEVACSYKAVFPKWIRIFNINKYDAFYHKFSFEQL